MTISSQSDLEAKPIGPILVPDPSRVLLRPFRPRTDDIARRVVARIMALSEEEACRLLDQVLNEFADRHERVDAAFRNRFAQVKIYLEPDAGPPSPERQMLIGAYFTHEYSPESAALFNPSIVPHPDQAGLPPGSLRFVLSLRATGEGHISSIVFRDGVISARHRVMLTPPARFLTEPTRMPNAAYTKGLFLHKVEEVGVQNDFCRRVLERLHGDFTLKELHAVLLASSLTDTSDATAARAARGILLLAESNFKVQFAPESKISQRVLFPSTPSQSNGIEDARFVHFQNDDGGWTYYATYTAYDGKAILPQLLETPDFVNFQFRTLHGVGVQNKGMALFPRKILGRYAMLSRQDDENILLMFSEKIDTWQAPNILIAPEQPWEFIKLGNCGSPIETPAGWLVFSHGVGAMRQYCLGAFLLDAKDPSRVIGRLRKPLLCPNEAEREGNVPNVVYTCGALLHGGKLIIPYAMSDFATSFATVSLDELLAAME